jgi:uroporphyrin-III C-methyltransferase / precorrin-2 dehydrogenase / sirohydrochlorin ferrochelatase
VDIFPISLKLQQQPCLIVGGGHIAYRKAVLLAKAGAVIDVIAPEIESSLLEIVETSQGQYVQAPFSLDIPLRNYRLVIAATNDKATNIQVFEACEAEKILVNSVDDPPHCRFMVPALIDRSPLVVSIATNGTSPVNSA